MSPRSNPESQKANKAARILAAATAAAGLMVGNSLRASQAEAAPKNPYVATMDSNFESIYKMIKTLRTHQAPGVEKPISVMDGGHKALKLAAEVKQTNSRTHQTGYNQVVVYVRPGQNLPYRIESYLQADSKDFSRDENYSMKQVMIRAEAGPKVYSITDHFLDVNNLWQDFNLVIGGKYQTPLPKSQMIQGLDDLTGLAEGVLYEIGSHLPGA